MKIKNVLLIIITATISGCMMHMMEMDHAHDSHSSMLPGSAQTIEAQNEHIKCLLKIPTLILSDEAEMTVIVSDRHSGSPISDAMVKFSMQHNDMMNMHDESNATEKRELEANEGSMKGMYVLRHAFMEPGKYKITVSVATSQKFTNSEPVVLSAIAEVNGKQDVHSNMHSQGGISPMIIIGGVIMVVMMGAMLGRYVF